MTFFANLIVSWLNFDSFLRLNNNLFFAEGSHQHSAPEHLDDLLVFYPFFVAFCIITNYACFLSSHYEMFIQYPKVFPSFKKGNYTNSRHFLSQDRINPNKLSSPPEEIQFIWTIFYGSNAVIINFPSMWTWVRH